MNRQCKVLASTDLKRAMGEPLTEAEVAEERRHLENCQTCRAERAAMDQLRADDSCDPAPALDELATQRLMNDVIATYSEDAGRRPYSRGAADSIRYRFAWSLAGAVVGAFVVLVVVFFTSDEGSEEIPAAHTRNEEEGRLVLISGEVLVDGESASVGQRLPLSSSIETQEGGAVVRLSQSLLVALDCASRIELGNKAQQNGLTIRLGRGALRGTLPPGSRSKPVRVVTEKGVIAVVGTAFEVRHVDGDVEVSVLRGEIELEGSGQRLGASETLRLGEGITRDLAPEQVENLWQKVLALESLGNTRLDTKLVVATTSGQAQVSIDERSSGRTPVEQTIDPGHHRLVISFDGARPIFDVVDIGPGQTLRRSYHQPELAEDLEVDSDTEATPETDEGPVDSRTARPVETARELLDRAQEFRSQQLFSKAGVAYRSLLERHPESSEASAAMVSLATIEIDHLHRPAEALRLYERYLSRRRGGPLVQEALYGRARALRALGRIDEEQEALNRFINRFPGAFHVTQARERLAEME